MYRNFKISDKERKQILESHMTHGYRKPLNENSYENFQQSVKDNLEKLTKDEDEYQKALSFLESNVDDVEFHYDPRGDFYQGTKDASEYIVSMIRNEELNSSSINLNKEASRIGNEISNDVIKLINSEISDDINSTLWDKKSDTFFNFYEKTLSTIMKRIYEDYADSFDTKVGAAPDEY